MSAFVSILRSSLLSVAGGFLLVTFQRALESTFLTTFLTENLVTILVALLAINSATIGIVLSKLRELSEENGAARFSKTLGEMKLALFEHLTLIVLAVLLLMLQNSEYAKDLTENSQTFLETCVFAIFCYSLILLYDSASSVFVLLETDRS